MFDRHRNSWYLPEQIRNVTFINELDLGLCGVRLFQLDENVSKMIIESGLSYLNNDKSLSKSKDINPYGTWRKTPVIEENLTALEGLSCADNSAKVESFDLNKIRLAKGEIEFDRSYYVTTKNRETVIFVLPKFSLVVFSYKDR